MNEVNKSFFYFKILFGHLKLSLDIENIIYSEGSKCPFLSTYVL